MKLRASRIVFSYTSARPILNRVSLDVDEGQTAFILGANGSGKTTLLHCMAGLLSPQSGAVTLNGDTIHDLSPRVRAQHLGLVPQWHEPLFDFTVEQAVLMGRAPHLGTFSRPGKDDREAVRNAMQRAGIDHLRHRLYTRISGGERQLVLIARGLAQGARWLLMDEPVAHLDPRHQHDVLSAVRGLAGQGFSFVITSHLPNHALLYADHLAFLMDGTAAIQGAPRDTLTEAALRTAYGMEFEIIRNADGPRAVVPRDLLITTGESESR